jgi:hypothetical protein
MSTLARVVVGIVGVMAALAIALSSYVLVTQNQRIDDRVTSKTSHLRGERGET